MLKKVLIVVILNLICFHFLNAQSMSQQYYDMGLNAMTQGDLKSAEVHFTRAIELNPNYADAYAQRGWVKWFSNRYADALKDYNAAISIRPEIMTTKNMRRIFRQLFEDYNDIIDDFDYTITIDTSEYKAYDGKEFVDLVTGDAYKKLSQYEREVKKDPTNVQRIIRLALAEFYIEDYEATIENCNRALEINPGTQWAYFLRGNAYAMINELRRSLRDYYSFIEFIDDFPLLYLNRGIVNIHLNNDFEALQDFDRAIKLRPDLFKAVYFKGKILGENGQLDEAIELLSSVIENEPDNFGAKVHRGLFYKQKNDYIEALSDYDEVLKFNTGMARAYHNRGNLKVMINDLKGAWDDYDMAIDLDENLSKTYFNRGVLKFLMGNPDDGCLDLWKSRDLGYEEAIDKTDRYCN